MEYLRSFGADDIAEHLGTSQNVINRVLQDLKDKNLIKLGRGKIKLVK
ncbi:helix-turn-helix domain-containing protein [Campylobacter showae]|nr:helix-turn-helix domain-containing protein [Campylobacter showae]